ncbi:hypothetical protein G7046_g3467 [Stylonectria norvegica]|nr:hypothetical protein G7046_g3467 [Stylonectria norvegica]
MPKRCACGKKEFVHVRCSVQKPRCGEACGELLKCGLHRCMKQCHNPGECNDGTAGCEQTCGKKKMLCQHACQNRCHGQSPCNEQIACQVKMTAYCPCKRVKKEYKCLTCTGDPEPKHPELKCDDECARLDRNRRLAQALNIDPATHTDDHVPYSDTTLKLYKELGKWADEQESNFRVFVGDVEEVRIRYKPLLAQARQFLHLLAEDFGLKSKSEDHAPRSLLVWKPTPTVSAPFKTLAQCVKIREAEAAEAAVIAALRPPSPPAPDVEPFNGFILTTPRFGLTHEDITAALKADLDFLPSFTFTIDFYSNMEVHDEILIRATAQYSAFLSPAPLEKALTDLKPRLEQTVLRGKLAQGVLLCHAAADAPSRARAPAQRRRWLECCYAQGCRQEVVAAPGGAQGGRTPPRWPPQEEAPGKRQGVVGAGGGCGVLEAPIERWSS